jgi:hypothetical protein
MTSGKKQSLVFGEAATVYTGGQLTVDYVTKLYLARGA